MSVIGASRQNKQNCSTSCQINYIFSVIEKLQHTDVLSLAYRNTNIKYDYQIFVPLLCMPVPKFNLTSAV